MLVHISRGQHTHLEFRDGHLSNFNDEISPLLSHTQLEMQKRWHRREAEKGRAREKEYNKKFRQSMSATVDDVINGRSDSFAVPVLNSVDLAERKDAKNGTSICMDSIKGEDEANLMNDNCTEAMHSEAIKQPILAEGSLSNSVGAGSGAHEVHPDTTDLTGSRTSPDMKQRTVTDATRSGRQKIFASNMSGVGCTWAPVANTPGGLKQRRRGKKMHKMKLDHISGSGAQVIRGDASGLGIGDGKKQGTRKLPVPGVDY
jgi:hypothetical protein